MTIVVPTKNNQGDLECGFRARYTVMTKIGKYAFLTEDLVALVRKMAKDPRIREEALQGTDIRTFDEREKRLQQKVTKKLLNDGGEIIKRIGELEPGERQIARIELNAKGTPVRFSVQADGKEVKIGDYVLSDLDFGKIAYYVVNGGYCGWNPEVPVPQFAVGAKPDLERSRNPLFSPLREMLRIT